MLPGTCNCDPFARTKGSFCGNLHEQSSFFDGFFTSHSSSFHTSGYLVPNRRPFPYFFDNRVGYLCGIDCTSSWRGLDEWNEGERLDREKRRVAPLEPGKVTINSFPRNSQPTYAIHSHKDYNTQRTPYLRSGMSDTSGERRWRTQAKLELGHCYIPSRERRQTGKKADHIGGANRKAQQGEECLSLLFLLADPLLNRRKANLFTPTMGKELLYCGKESELSFQAFYCTL